MTIIYITHFASLPSFCKSNWLIAEIVLRFGLPAYIHHFYQPLANHVALQVSRAAPHPRSLALLNIHYLWFYSPLGFILQRPTSNQPNRASMKSSHVLEIDATRHMYSYVLLLLIMIILTFIRSIHLCKQLRLSVHACSHYHDHWQAQKHILCTINHGFLDGKGLSSSSKKLKNIFGWIKDGILTASFLFEQMEVP